jgi:hypothetical protein
MRTLLVEGKKTFRIGIPDDARVTFGPFSPPTAESKYSGEKALAGTLRVYKGGTTKTSENILAVFTDVRSFRDLSSVEYEERVATEEVRTVWKTDKDGYRSEVSGKVGGQWVSDTALLESGTVEGESEEVF